MRIHRRNQKPLTDTRESSIHRRRLRSLRTLATASKSGRGVNRLPRARCDLRVRYRAVPTCAALRDAA